MQDPNRFAVTPKTQVHRQPSRACYDRAAANAILDEAVVASVGIVNRGEPYVLPMVFARDDGRLFLHSASSSRIATVLGSKTRICVTVTLLDGIVFARSAMHHSVNYRSVVVLGSPLELSEESEKRQALAQLLEHVLTGRSQATRSPNSLELKATRVFAIPLEEVSVKCRQGGPIDDVADLETHYWAGTLPIEQRTLEPIADPLNEPRAPIPAGLARYCRKQSVGANEAVPQ